jgi:hypothetical protein
MNEGKVYTNVSFPFTPIDRASATAAITSGVTPYYNNIAGQRWLNRETLKPVYCLGDSLSTGMLLASTVGDELKVATEGNAKVYSVAPFEDAALLGAGHAANGAFWIDDIYGRWRSATCFSPQPQSWLAVYNVLHAPAKEDGKFTWTPVNEQSGAFNFFQHSANNNTPFNHRISGADSYKQLKTSGLINSYVTEMAQQCVKLEIMGFDRVTDFLAVSYYAGTFDHHPVSECQIELQDTYVRLDRELSKLITDIEKRIGAEHVLFVVTSTGYSDEDSADYAKYHIPTGTFYINRTADLLNMYFGALWGLGRYVDAYFGNQLFLNHRLLESKRISLTDACQRAQEFLVQMSGVRNVYSGLQLQTIINEQTLKVRNGYNAERCGDILIEVSPGWRIYNEDSHDSQQSHASFIQFPIIFYGANIQAGKVSSRVTTDRIAPTIAKTIRIRAPNACSAEPLF